MTKKTIKFFIVLGILSLTVGTPGKASALMVDLSTDDSGTLNGVTFEFDQQQPTGTGVLDPFLRIQRNGAEQGYNTTVNNNGQLPFEEVFGNFTHDLLFSSLEVYDGAYWFVLDIGEPVVENANQGKQSLLSLDGLKFYSTNTPGQNDDSVDSDGNASGISGTLLWDMDELEDNHVLLDANREGNPGNGVSDMLMKVPEIIFSDITDEYIILWSRFGLQQESNPGSESFGTFEEWAHVTGLGNGDDNGGGGGFEVIPEPGTFLLFGAGLLGLGLWGARRKS